MTASLESLELELRRLPGVVFVGITFEQDSQVIHLLATGGSAEALRREAVRLGRLYAEVPVTVKLSGVGLQPLRVQRVQLLSVRMGGEDEIEVHLSFRDKRTVGRARAGDLGGAVKATLEALTSLGAQVPFAVQDTVVLQPDPARVVVALDSEDAGVRYGAAGAPRVEDAAARATLHALNRFLAFAGPAPAPGPGPADTEPAVSTTFVARRAAVAEASLADPA